MRRPRDHFKLMMRKFVNSSELVIPSVARNLTQLPASASIAFLHGAFVLASIDRPAGGCPKPLLYLCPGMTDN